MIQGIFISCPKFRERSCSLFFPVKIAGAFFLSHEPECIIRISIFKKSPWNGFGTCCAIVRSPGVFPNSDRQFFRTRFLIVDGDKTELQCKSIGCGSLESVIAIAFIKCMIENFQMIFRCSFEPDSILVSPQYDCGFMGGFVTVIQKCILNEGRRQGKSLFRRDPVSKSIIDQTVFHDGFAEIKVSQHMGIQRSQEALFTGKQPVDIRNCKKCGIINRTIETVVSPSGGRNHAGKLSVNTLGVPDQFRKAVVSFRRVGGIEQKFLHQLSFTGPAVLFPMRTISRNSDKVGKTGAKRSIVKPGQTFIFRFYSAVKGECRTDKTRFQSGKRCVPFNGSLHILKPVIGKTGFPDLGSLSFQNIFVFLKTVIFDETPYCSCIET